MRFITLFLFLLSSLQGERVLVSISPYKKIVEELLSNHVEVTTFVPPGTSMHHFEPTPRMMQESAKADLWLRIGEPFETAAMRALLQLNPRMLILDLRTGIPLLQGKEAGCIHCSGGVDLHIWLDPSLLSIQSEAIAKALKRLYPEREAEIDRNLTALKEKLKALDRSIQDILAPLSFRAFLVNHPAYAYFAKRYALTQVALEHEGHDPTPRHLTEVINWARDNHLHKIFIQKQYNSKGAELVAQALNLKLVALDPYNEEIFDELKKTAEDIASP